MIRKIKREMNRRVAALGFVMSMTFAASAMAAGDAPLPQNGDVRYGSADIVTADKRMDINQSSKTALIDWQSFDVAKDHTVNFNNSQYGAASVTVNRVVAANPSDIYGNINAVGQIALINPYGINIYDGAQINAGSFIASTRDFTEEQYKALMPEYNTDAGDYILAIYIDDEFWNIVDEIINEGNHNEFLKYEGALKNSDKKFFSMSATNGKWGKVFDALIAKGYKEEKIKISDIVELKNGMKAAPAGQPVPSPVPVAPPGVLNDKINIEGGKIKAEGGLVALLAKDITNKADIEAHDVVMGKALSISIDYKINVAADAAAVAGRVYNAGAITADGGTVIMTAKDASALASGNVADTGVIQAGRIENINGQVELVADEADIQVLGYVEAKNVTAKATGGNITVRNMLEPKKESIVAAAGGKVSLTADRVDISADISTKGGSFTTTATENNISGKLTTGGGVATFDGGVNLTGDTVINTEGNLAEKYPTTVVVKNGDSDADITGNNHDLTMVLGKGNAKLKDINGVNDVTLSGQGIAARNIIATGKVASVLDCVGIGQSVQGTDVSFDGTGNFNSKNADITATTGNVTIKTGTYLDVKNVSADKGTINLNAAGHHTYVYGDLTADGDIAVYSGGVERGEVSISGDTVKSENGSVKITSENSYIMAKKANITAENGQVLLSAAAGNSAVKDIIAGKNISFTAGDGSIKTENITSNGGTVNLDADGAIEVKGNVIAKGAGDTNHHAVNIDSRTSVKAGAITAENGDITLSTKNATNTGTTIDLGGDLTAKGSIYVQAKDTVSTTGDITSTGEGNIKVAGTINATKDTFKVSAKKGNIDTDAINATGNIGMLTEAGNITLNGALTAGGQINAEAKKGDLTAKKALTAGNGDVKLTDKSGTINIEGQITATKDVSVEGKKIDIKNSTGVIAAGNKVTIKATDYNLKVSNGAADATSSNIDAEVFGNTLGNAKEVELIVNENGDKKGSISINNAVAKTAGGDVNLKLNASRDVEIAADIKSQSGALNIELTPGGQAYSWQNKAAGVNKLGGTIATNGGTFVANGVVQLKNDTVVDTTEINNREAGSKVDIRGNITGDSGLKVAAGDAEIALQEIAVKNAELTTTGTIGAGNITVTDNATISAKEANLSGDITSTVAGNIKVAGTINAAKDVFNISAQKGNIEVDNVKAGGTVNVVATDGSVTAKELDASSGDIAVEAAATVNADVIKAGQAAKVKAADIAISDGAWSGSGALTLEATGGISAKQLVSNDSSVLVKAAGSAEIGQGSAGEMFRVEAGNATVGTAAAKDILIIAEEDVMLTGNQTAADSLNIVAGGNFTAGTNGLSVTGGKLGWKVFLTEPGRIVSGPNSNNLARWGTGFEDGYTSGLNQYVFRNRPMITVAANDFIKPYATVTTGAGVRYSTDIEGRYTDYFTDGTLRGDAIRAQLLDGNPQLGSDGFARYAAAGDYDINVDATGLTAKTGYDIATVKGVVTVDDTDFRNSLEANNQDRAAVTTSNIAGNGNILQGAAGLSGVDRVLGLTEGTLAFSQISKKQITGTVSYDIKVTPDEVQVTKSAKQGKRAAVGKANQYRGLSRNIPVNGQEATFDLTYDGSTLNIYPTDDASKAMLRAGAANDNVEVTAKALHTSFQEMGLELDDLDSVAVHLDATEAESK